MITKYAFLERLRKKAIKDWTNNDLPSNATLNDVYTYMSRHSNYSPHKWLRKLRLFNNNTLKQDSADNIATRIGKNVSKFALNDILLDTFGSAAKSLDPLGHIARAVDHRAGRISNKQLWDGAFEGVYHGANTALAGTGLKIGGKAALKASNAATKGLRALSKRPGKFLNVPIQPVPDKSNLFTKLINSNTFQLGLPLAEVLAETSSSYFLGHPNPITKAISLPSKVINYIPNRLNEVDSLANIRSGVVDRALLENQFTTDHINKYFEPIKGSTTKYVPSKANYIDPMNQLLNKEIAIRKELSKKVNEYEKSKSKNDYSKALKDFKTLQDVLDDKDQLKNNVEIQQWSDLPIFYWWDKLLGKY